MSLNFGLVFRTTPPRSHPPSSKPQHILAESETQLPATLFHDHWWLSAATNGEFQEAVVTNGSGVSGLLPYVITRERGFAICQMPPFTHVLGPVVYPGSGKPQTQLLRRLSI